MVLVYKSFHRLAPPYLSDDCQLITDVGRRHLWSADVHTCTVARTQSRLGDRNFGVAGPRLWNSLPAELWQQDICLTEFRWLLKTFLFAETRHIVTSCFNGTGYKHSYLLTYLLTYLVTNTTYKHLNRHPNKYTAISEIKQILAEARSYFWMLLWRLDRFWPQRSSVLRLIVKLMESMHTLSIEIHNTLKHALIH